MLDQCLTVVRKMDLLAFEVLRIGNRPVPFIDLLVQKAIDVALCVRAGLFVEKRLFANDRTIGDAIGKSGDFTHGCAPS